MVKPSDRKGKEIKKSPGQERVVPRPQGAKKGAGGGARLEKKKRIRTDRANEEKSDKTGKSKKTGGYVKRTPFE